jgi:hypothetical protein
MPLDPIGSMHIHLALARFSIGDPDGAAEQARAVRERCAALPFPLGPFTTIYGLLLEASIEVDKGDVAAARRLVGEALELASHHGFDAWLFWASMMGQVLDAWLAPPEDVRAVVDEVTTSIGLWDAIGTRVLTGGLQVLVSRWLLSRGDLAGVSAAAAAVLATAEETGSVARVLDARRMVALAGPDDQRDAALIAVLDDAVAAGARAAAVEIAADLVRSGGVQHLPRLDAALERISADADYPVLTAARSLAGR